MRLMFLAFSLVAAGPALAGQPLPPPAYAPPYAPAAPYAPGPYAPGQYAPPGYAPYAPQGYGPAPMILPPLLTDPRMADQLGRVAGAVTRSLLDVPVGEVEAAIAGRPATRADRQRTMRSQIGDPNIDRRVEREAAASGRQIQAAGQAMSRALPAIMSAVQGVTAEIERAVGNLPDPYYPRR